MATAEKIASQILTDVTDRKGWAQEYHGFDADVRLEIWRSFVRIIKAGMIDNFRAGQEDMRRRAEARGTAWTKPDALKLAAGEMTAQELRTAVAVAKGIASAIATLPILDKAGE